MERAPKQTVDNDIARGSIDRQRGRIWRFCWEECVRFIVGIPRTESSKRGEGIKTRSAIQVKMFEQRLQFLDGGHRLRLSV